MKTHRQQLQDRSELTALYPTPKTYDEKLAERQTIHAVRRSWQTKHPRVQIALIIATLLVSLVVIAALAPILFGNPLSGVSLVFLFGVAWFGGLIMSIRAIRTIIDTNEHL